MEMTLKAKIHIGTQKTGTTTLQDFLFENRASLERQGFLFRRYGRQGNQPELAVATFHGLGEMLGDNVLKTALGIRNLEDQARVARELDADIARENSGNSNATTLFSCELLGAPARGTGFVGAFRDWALERFEEAQVVVYIRRQDRYAESCYSQYLRGGGSKTLERYLEDFQPPNYNRMVRLWESHFGEENVIVRRLQRTSLVGGDLIQDYCAIVGIDATDLVRTKTLNQSFSTQQATWIRNANASLPEPLRRGNLDRFARWVIRSSATTLASGTGPDVRMSEASRVALLRSVAKSNDQLRKRRFPGDESLFE